MKLRGGREPTKDIEYISSAQRVERGGLAVEESGVIGLTDIEAEILTGRASGMPNIIYYSPGERDRSSEPSPESVITPEPEPVGASASSSAPSGAPRGRGRPRSERTPTRGRTRAERRGTDFPWTPRGPDFSVNPQGEAEDISAPQEGQGPFPGDDDNGNGSAGVSGLDNLNLGI